MPEVLEKMKKLKKIIDKKKLNVDIEIDGGINFKNCTLAKVLELIFLYLGPQSLKKIVEI